MSREIPDCPVFGEVVLFSRSFSKTPSFTNRLIDVADAEFSALCKQMAPTDMVARWPIHIVETVEHTDDGEYPRTDYTPSEQTILGVESLARAELRAAQIEEEAAHRRAQSSAEKLAAIAIGVEIFRADKEAFGLWVESHALSAQAWRSLGVGAPDGAVKTCPLWDAAPLS